MGPERGRRRHTEHGPSSSGVRGHCLNRGAPSAGHAGSQDGEVLCWEEGQSEQLVALVPPWACLLTHEHPASRTAGHSHTFLLPTPLTQTLFYYSPCFGQWKQTRSSVQMQSLGITREGRQGWHPGPTPPDSSSCSLPC